MSSNWLLLNLFIILSKILGNTFGKSNALRKGLFRCHHKCLWWLQKKVVLAMSAQGIVFGKSGQDLYHWVKLIHGSGLFTGFHHGSVHYKTRQYGRNSS